MFYTDGVWVSILGANVANDGYVALDDLTSRTDAMLLCNTNKIDCCNHRSNDSLRFGDWYFPNKSRVLHRTQIGDIGAAFVRNRGPSVVRMFCRGSNCSMQNVSTPSLLRGRYRCEVPNASNINITRHVNICTLYVYWLTLAIIILLY